MRVVVTVGEDVLMDVEDEEAIAEFDGVPIRAFEICPAHKSV